MKRQSTATERPLPRPDVGTTGTPLVELHRLDGTHPAVRAGQHGHRRLELVYFEHGGGTHRVNHRQWDIDAGDLFLIAPGQRHDVGALRSASGWVLLFPADALLHADHDAHAFFAWRTNPLLAPFLHAYTGPEPARVSVPAGDRARWSSRFEALATELGGNRVGAEDAARAYLTLFMVDIARLVELGDEDWTAVDRSVLAGVFRTIDERFPEPISARDIAASVALSPGYLTTLVRRATGRTILQWLIERRMAEARWLLSEGDEPVEVISGRVGYDDPAYFARLFRKHHGVTPLAWRRGDRARAAMPERG